MVFPGPEKSSDGKYHVRFFSHGLRYLFPAVLQFIDEHLRPLAQLLLTLDSQKPHDPSAVALRTTEPALHVGYCPRFLTADVHHLLQTVPATVHVAVERVNRDTPRQLRLLCSLRPTDQTLFSRVRMRCTRHLLDQIVFVHWADRKNKRHFDTGIS